MALTVGSLFSGIGGFDLGFERAGMQTLWFVEPDPFCQYILAKRFPHAARHRDVRHVSGATLASVDVLCGGFPCQDISSVNAKAKGLDGARSGLWGEFYRLCCELRPKYLVLENSPLLASRGLSRVLSDLAEVGYDAEWDCLPACDLGAPHIRERIWLVAYPNQVGRPGARSQPPVFDATKWAEWKSEVAQRHQWSVESEPPRVDVGFPHRMDKDWKRRVQATGNALVPQIVEWLGRQILAREDQAV